MDRTFFRVYPRNFVAFIVVEEKAKLPVIRLSCGIVVSLKFHQKFIRNRTESYFNLLGFFYVLLVERLIIRFIIEELTVTRVVLLIKVDASDNIIFFSADLGDFKELKWSTLDISGFFMGAAINFENFVV